MATRFAGFASAGIMLLLSALPALGVTITFEVLPDGTPIQNEFGCEEVTFETFRPWGVLFNVGAPEDSLLNIKTTLCCLSGSNALGVCGNEGLIDITFVVPDTDISTVVDAIDLALETGSPAGMGRVNTYDAQGVLLDSWSCCPGFCFEHPFHYGFYHFAAPGQIARVECDLFRMGIDDVVVTEGSTPVEATTWGRIKSTFH